jgi:uncharacterized OB-fold protein
MKPWLRESSCCSDRLAAAQRSFRRENSRPASGAALEWVEASGAGVVYSVTWIQRKPPEAPYNVVLVDLEEGARMMARVEGVTPQSLQIGMAVKARIAEGPVVVFDPVEWIDG